MSQPRRKDTSIHVEQRDKLKDGLSIRELQWTPKQKEFISLILDKSSKIIYLKGPAGSAKTIVGLYCGLVLLHQKRVSDIVYVRSIIESASKSLGALPGEVSEKFSPFLMPLEDKLDELLPKNEIDKLLKDKRVHAVPVNYLRGANMNLTYALVDETQNFSYAEILTTITRLGKFSKMVLCGDIQQSDIQGKSGFKKMFDTFNDEISKQNGIHCLEFTKDDIMRSGVVKFILEHIEAANANDAMFVRDNL